jgi:hypothetical protein
MKGLIHRRLLSFLWIIIHHGGALKDMQILDTSTLPSHIAVRNLSLG